MIKNLVLALSIASIITLIIEKIGYNALLNEQDKVIQKLHDKLEEERLSKVDLNSHIDILIKHVPIWRFRDVVKDLDEYRTKTKFDQIVSEF